MMTANDKHQCTNHFLCIAAIIRIKIVFHISYQCDIMSEITSNIILQGYNYNRLLKYFIPQRLLMINMNA